MTDRIFVISDMHLGNNTFVEQGLRPKDFSEKILTNLNRMLNPSDLLIDLGDTCEVSGDWIERLSFITCKKWFAKGNHDSKSFTWYMNHGYDFVSDGFRLEIFGKKIFFSHMPVKDDGWFDINIHGHFHNFGLERVKEVEPELYEILTPKHELISIEELNYQPIKLKRILEIREKSERVPIA